MSKQQHHADPKSSIVGSERGDTIALKAYQERARGTDQNTQTGVSGLHLPILGLFGEVGGLLSELKKKQRDKDSYIGYHESVIEEFGDTLWYLTNIADRLGLDLASLAQDPSSDGLTPTETGINHITAFSELQSDQQHTGPASDAYFERSALALAAKTGALLQHFSGRKLDSDDKVLLPDLRAIFAALVQAANSAGISLEDAARRNMTKISSRWPPEKKYPPLFDADFPHEEQLPRTLTVALQEKVFGQRVFVMQQANGINIGDRLTDNIAEADDYRFHDVFHWSYAAILGWSPVTRALLRLKRKSNPATDENEDGARAQLIEEGTATWIFNHGRRLNFYEKISTVDYRLLKSIQEFVRGYEVEGCPLWLWEKAILEGFRTFRFLKEHRKGVLLLDLAARKIEVSPLR
jgi:NTP pyrophosphatase (non-canonical NTP hydrolase)